MVQDKRPLVGVALLFCAGILIGRWLPVPLVVSGGTVMVLLIAFAVLYPTRFHSWVFFPIPLIWGLFSLESARAIQSPADLRLLLGSQPQHVGLRGIVWDWPEIRWRQSARGEFGRTSLTLRVQEVRRTERWEPAEGKILVHFQEWNERRTVQYGDKVELHGAVEMPPPARNPGQFDYRGHLARQGVFYQCRLLSADDLVVRDRRQGRWLMQVASDANEYFKRVLSHGLDSESETVGLLQAIVLGFRPGLTQELAEPFMRTGTLHVFAVSGFHIATMGAILVAVLRLLRLSRTASGLLSIPLLLVYTLITGAPPSASRAFIMASVVILAWSLCRPTDIYNSLAAAALLVLNLNPQQLFDAGFQLSFFVVLAIALFTPRVHDRLQRWAKPDPFLPWDVLPAWRRRLFRPLNKTLLFLAVSFAAVVGSAPLIATYFHLVTPVAFISNLVVVPLSGAAIALGFMSMVSGMVLPWATELFNNANYLLLQCNVWLTERFAEVAFGYWYVPSPPWWLTVAYYAVAAAWLGGWAWQSRRNRLLTLIGSGLFLAALAAVYLKPTRPVLTVLDVGGGQAAVLNQPGSNDLIIDGGRRGSGENVVRPCLRSEGITRPAAFLLTVNNIHHAGGLLPLRAHFPTVPLYESGFRSRSKDYRQLIASFVDGHDRHTLRAPQELTFAPRLRLRVLHPPPGPATGPLAEDNSLVLLLECDGLRVLFKGAIGQTVETTLVQQDAVPRCHILVAGHHPTEPTLTDGFLDAARPDVVILNAGSFPLRAYPPPDLLERLATRRIALYRTDRCGGVRVTFHGDSYFIRPTLPCTP